MLGRRDGTIQPMNTTFSIDMGAKLDVMGIINKEVFPLVHQAVRAIAQQTAADWQANVYAAKLWMGEKDAYAKTITWKMTGDFTAVVSSDYRYDRDIENGRPARDLKRMLDTSVKVRRTKDGRRFLVIPFRHSMQKLMAAGIYNMAKRLEATTITGQSQRASGEVTDLNPKIGMAPAARQSAFLSNTKTKQQQMVTRNHYAWGQALKKGSTMRAGITAEARKWADGMHRFDTSTPGGGKSSVYLSFRIMMEGSDGWIVPAQPGQHIAQKTAQAMQSKAQTVFAEAIKRSLA